MTTTDAHADAPLDAVLRLPPDERAAWLRTCGDGPATLLQVVDEAGARLTADPAAAVDVLHEVIALADEVNDAVARARARRAQARALSYVGRFAEALLVCDEAVRIAEAAEAWLEAGRARLASMHALTETGRLDEAVQVGEAARRLFLSIDRPEMAARADINLGVAYQRRDQPEEAVEYFDRARPLLLDDPLIVGHLENNRGETLVVLNDFAAAERAYAAALERFEAANADVTAAISESNLADLAVRQGRLARAMHFFERARHRFEEANAAGHLARLKAEQAEAMALLGMPVEALRQAREALDDLDRCRLPFEAARLRQTMGLLYTRVGQPASAETALAAAATAYDELGHATAKARVDLVRAELAAHNGRSREARTLALRALPALDARPADAAMAHLTMARMAMMNGDREQALAALHSALVPARRLDIAPLIADVLALRGRVHLDMGSPGEAVADLEQAVDQVERVRGSLQAERFRMAFLGDRTAVYETLVDAVLTRRAPDAVAHAFRVAEQAKSRMLLDQMVQAMSAPTDPDQVDGRPATEDATDGSEPKMRHVDPLSNELLRIRGELNALYSRLADEQLSHGDAEALRRWREAVRDRERKLDDIEMRLASLHGVGQMHRRTSELTELQRTLGTELLVEYFAVGDEVIAFAITRDSASVYRQVAVMADLEQRLDRLQFQFERAVRHRSRDMQRAASLRADVDRELRELHDVLLGPVRHRLDETDRVVVVPHGLLHLVPFHALRSESAYLVETHEVRYVPSASLLAQLQDVPVELKRRCAVIGVPDAVAPRIADEARSVAALLGVEGGDVLLADDATADRVVRVVTDASVVHFACHGRYSPDNPQGSGLCLSDRWLTVRDIQRLRLRSALVTLSGCETGLNRVAGGDELVGLLRGFFSAGARSILASLWRVDDETTFSFMCALYEQWCTLEGAERRAVAAVRAAQLTMLRARPHPAYWAPFFLEGGA